MRSSLMEILACPRCKYHPLDLTIGRQEGNEVMEGVIACSRCHTRYPIDNAIPRMMVPEQ